MAKFRKIYPSFAGGVQTPKIASRVDLAAYHTGADEIVNFIVLPQGGVFNRPGTTRHGSIDYDSVRLVPFVFGEDDSCVLAFTGSSDSWVEGYVDFYDGITAFHSIESPYSAERLEGLRWLQSGDILYLFHREEPVRKLMRYGRRDWRFEDVSFKGGPYRDMNTDENRTMAIVVTDVAPYQRAVTNFPFFTDDPDMRGMPLKIETKIKPFSDAVTIVSPGVDVFAESEPIMPYGAFTVESTGKWIGETRILRRFPDETDFIAVKTYTSKEDYNFQYIYDVDEYGTEFKFAFAVGGSGAYNTIELKFDWAGAIINREFRIALYQNEQSVLVEPLDGIAAAIPATSDWAIGAFGPPYGYPGLGVFHQERLILAATKTDRQTIWMSQPASWEDFSTSIPAEDTDGITATLAAKQINEIRGFSSRPDLLIFTGGGEFVAQAGAKSDVFTPSSFVVTPSSYRGSADIEPLDIGSTVFFAQRHGKVVRAMGYEENIGGYTTNEVTIMAEHLFEDSALKRWCYQQEPWSLVWFVLKDGTVRTLTVQQEHQVWAWSVQDFGAPVRDICSIPGTSQDMVYLAVERDGRIRVELLNVRDDRPGKWAPEMFKDAGTLPVASLLVGKQMEEQVSMTLQGKHKLLPYGTIRVHRTCGFKAGIVTENSGIVDRVRFPGDTSPRIQSTPYSGDLQVEWPGGTGRNARIRLENSDPHPVTILGIYPEVEINDG